MVKPEVKETVLYCLEREWNNTKQSGTRYWAFYPHTFGVRMHDNKAEVLKVRVVEDPEGTYWGWWDLDSPPDHTPTSFYEQRTGNTSPRFLFVYPEHMLLNMCFPYGMEVEEERGHGKCYKVRVEVLEKVPNES